ncbi:MAG: hypothetical protein EHM58_08570 [Ignavibacteriae bacterium]|nr:MAG: hypothetical protein EHM58_08570 [Ignavibacteriota bacterium]
MKYSLITLLFVIILLPGCRDYLSNLETNSPPVLFTNAAEYISGDSIIVTLSNNSTKTIYTNEVYNFAQKKINGAWEFYASFSCNNCYEFSLVKNQAFSVKSKPINDKGVFRFVCLYGTSLGTSEENKIKLFSNEFSIN